MDIYSIDYDNTLCFTGHRPHKLYGYEYSTGGNLRILKNLKALIVRFIEKRGVTTFISGMALGIDMWSAQIILSLKKEYPHIKLVCAIPCIEQYKKWNSKDIEIYHEILEQADLVHYVSDEPYTRWCMTVRDKWMVDNSRFTIAVWDGVKDGGTWQTVKYARKRQRPIVQLNPKTFKMNFLNA